MSKKAWSISYSNFLYEMDQDFLDKQHVGHLLKGLLYYTMLYYTTVCPRSSYPFHIVIYYIKWVTISWTYSIILIVVWPRVFCGLPRQFTMQKVHYLFGKGALQYLDFQKCVFLLSNAWTFGNIRAQHDKNKFKAELIE